MVSLPSPEPAGAASSEPEPMDHDDRDSPPARGSSAPPLPPNVLSSPLSVLGSPMKRKRGRQPVRKVQRRAEKTMTPAEVRAYREAEKEKRQLRQTEVWRVEMDQINADRIAEKAKVRTEHVRDTERDRLAEAEAEEMGRARRVTVAVKALKNDHGFKSLWDFLDAFFRSKDQQVSAQASRFARQHGPDIMHHLSDRDPEGTTGFAVTHLVSRLRVESDGLARMLSRRELTSVTGVLETFSMDSLMDELTNTSPTLVQLLEEVALTPARRVHLDQEGKSRRDHKVVMATVCCMLTFSRNEKSSNFQLVFGLFLLASGAKKSLIEVLAHAGLSMSYMSIVNNVKRLSIEGIKRFIGIVHSQMCMIVWDNINIAFRVAQQRVDSKDHFDNGTTATLIPLFSPQFPGPVPHGSLPLSFKPPRTARKTMSEVTVDLLLPNGDQERELRQSCLWQLKCLAVGHVPGLKRLRGDLGHAPIVFKIPLHKTEQYPLPAMKIDESSIEGCIEVIITIICKILQMSEDDVRRHGLFFVDGDLLTVMLLDKVEAARRADTDLLEGLQFTVRRFGIFHAKMAGNRMIINQHWGTPNSKWPGSLWKENMVAGRKMISAGWKAKKFPPWKTCHELLHISTAAHVYDAYRIISGTADFVQWAHQVSFADFEVVSERVLDTFFSSQPIARERAKSPEVRDHIFENTLLYNRDVLPYIELCDAVKTGDIGRVVNVFRIWMVMMRGGNRMPKYADAIFETLSRLESYPDALRESFLVNWLVNLSGKENGWKEVDLLQEHHNFWAKIIYTAKGVNKSWEWLSMITVCIFVLRDSLRTMHEAFSTTPAGTRHTNPDMAKEVQLIADFLQKERVQTYVCNREGNEDIDPVGDLFALGAGYPHTAKAFRNFLVDPRRAEHGATPSGGPSGQAGSAMGADEEPLGPDPDDVPEEYEVDVDDLTMDGEEFPEWTDTMLQAAIALIQSMGM